MGWGDTAVDCSAAAAVKGPVDVLFGSSVAVAVAVTASALCPVLRLAQGSSSAAAAAAVDAAAGDSGVE